MSTRKLAIVASLIIIIGAAGCGNQENTPSLTTTSVSATSNRQIQINPYLADPGRNQRYRELFDIAVPKLISSLNQDLSTGKSTQGPDVLESTACGNATGFSEPLVRVHITMNNGVASYAPLGEVHLESADGNLTVDISPQPDGIWIMGFQDELREGMKGGSLGPVLDINLSAEALKAIDDAGIETFKKLMDERAPGWR